jgi:archaellum biogenesis ATPase FlaH
MAQKYDVFISYGQGDFDWVRTLVENLHRANVDVFFDHWDILAGDIRAKEVQEALRSASASIVVLSPSSLQRPWFNEEFFALLERAAGGRWRLIPVLIGDLKEDHLPGFVAARSAVDFRGADQQTYQHFFEELVEAVRGQSMERPPRDGEVVVPESPSGHPGTAVAVPSDGDRLLCLILARGDEADGPVGEAIQRAARQAGLRAVPPEEVVGSTQPAEHRTGRAIDRSLLVVALGTRVVPALKYALQGRPCLLLSRGSQSTSRRRAKPRPNLVRLTFDDSSDAGLRRFERELTDTLRELLETIGAWIHEVGRTSSETGTRIPPDLFELPLEVRDSQGAKIGPDEVHADRTLFPTFLSEIAHGRRVVVTGLPGSGKSVLVTRYCVWLQRHGRQPGQRGVSAELPPLAVVLRADDLEKAVELARAGPTATITSESLWSVIRSKVLAGAALARHGERLQGVIEALRDRGGLHLVIDGFDEFASRNRAQLRDSLRSLDELAAQGANVLVACRENFWDEQVRDAASVDLRIRLLEIGNEEAKRLLVDIPLPPAARSESDGTIAQWLRSPLLIRFLRVLHENDDPATRSGAVLNRTAVYQQWADWVAREAARLELHADFFQLCANVALQFVEQRRFQLDPGVVLDRINRGRGRQRRLTSLSQLDALEVFERATEQDEILNPAAAARALQGQPVRTAHGARVVTRGLKFHHETILEYFATAKLCEDFLAVVAEPPRSDLHGLRLASLPLDYFQSSVYGFLDEMLEPSGYRLELAERLSSVDLTAMPEHLLRNLIEYLGLTARDGSDRELAELLVSIVEDERLGSLIRYNAARALERSHPLGPRPYFEYVSDWGTTDFDAFTDRQITQHDDGPWVIRGWKALAPACRRYLTFAPNHPTLPMDAELQRDISARLLSLLAGLVRARRGDQMAVRVNVSLALVRWYHPADYDRWRELCRQCNRTEIEPETVENLEKWVMRWPDSRF